jgi:hypothetical protein
MKGRTLYVFVGIVVLSIVAGVVAIRRRTVTSDSVISSLYKDSLSQPKTEDDGSTLTTTIYLRLSRTEAKEALQKILGRDWSAEAPPNGNYTFKQGDGRVIVIYLPRVSAQIPSDAKSAIKYQRINTPF